MLLKQIFIEEGGQPIRMYIHPSIANVNARSALSQRIMVSHFLLFNFFLGYRRFSCPMLRVIV